MNSELINDLVEQSRKTKTKGKIPFHWLEEEFLVLIEWYHQKKLKAIEEPMDLPLAQYCLAREQELKTEYNKSFPARAFVLLNKTEE